MPAPISTFENFLNIKVILIKCGHVYYSLLGNENLKKIYIDGITCCHGNTVSDAMFTQVLIFVVFFSIN